MVTSASIIIEEMPEQFLVIPAVAADQKAIGQLIRKVSINPFGLKWYHFAIIKDENGRLIACGQLKPHKGNSIELASIAVTPSHRKQGFARQIIEYLIATQAPPIYLMCEIRLVSFYEQFGFALETTPHFLPKYFKWIFRVAKFIQIIRKSSPQLAIMSLRTNRLTKITLFLP